MTEIIPQSHDLESARLHHDTDKGFTLVELLIVIVILGILAAVTVFAVGGVTGTAEQNACEVELSTTQTALEAYAVDNNGAYPANLGALTPTYLRDAPSDPSFVYVAATGSLTGCGSSATTTP